MATVNQVLADESVAHSVSLDKFKLGVVRRIIALLNKSDANLADALRTALDQMPADSFTVERLESLLGQVRQINADAYTLVSKTLQADMSELAGYEVGWQHNLFEATIPQPVLVRFPLVSVSAEQVYAAAMARPFQGRLLRDWASHIEADRMVKIRNAVRTGYLEGKTTDQIVRTVRGSRVAGYADGFLERPRQDLATVVRTALSHTAAVARENLYQANAQIIAAEDWTSTLDTKTSEGCRIRDKKAYEVGTHKPIGHKIPWLQGPGRLHFNAVPAGSMVETIRGPVAVEQISIGDLVLTHTGQFKPVTDTRSKVNESGVIRTVHMESGRVLRATDDHPVFVSGKGWCFVGMIEVGDALFCNPEQTPEECAAAGIVVADSEYGPSISDEYGVALGRTIELAAASIDFEGDLKVGPSEIEDVVCGAVLENPALIECQSRLHYLLALADLLTKYDCHALGELLAGLISERLSLHSHGNFLVEASGLFSGKRAFENSAHMDRVAGFHASGMSGMDFTGLFGHPEGPMIVPGFRGSSAIGEVCLGLLSLGANGNIHDPGVSRKGAVSEPISAFDRSKGQAILDMLFQDELGVIRQRFRHDRVITLELSHYNNMVYDLAVEDSASYVCNGIVVSNCRSTSSPRTKSWRELGIPVDELTDKQRASMDGAVPADLDYSAWLERQSDARKLDVLGPVRYQMYKQGRALDEFYSPTGQWLTIEQMQAQDAQAFAKMAA